MNEQYIDDLVNDALAESNAELEAKKKSKKEKLIRDARPMVKIDIWCDECKKDYEVIGFKRVEGLDAVYHTRCPNEHIVLRRITDKHKDLYYRQSILLKTELRRYADDLLQEGEQGYWEKYGKHQQLEKERQIEDQLRSQPKDKAHKHFYAL